MQKPSTAVVILNWNGKHFLEKFLPNVVKFSQEATIYVADNASDDDSVAFVEENFKIIKVIKNKENGGFCKGYNQALAQIKADYFILLNSDVEVTFNWISPIIERMQSDKNIAICQPKILNYYQKDAFEYAGASGGFLDNLGYPYCRGRIFDTLELDTNQYDSFKQVAWATGACMFIKSNIYYEMNGLDEDFFAHMEEIDLCWRVQHFGYIVMVCPESHVFHVGGGTLPKNSALKTYLNFRNGLFLLHKNLPQKYFFILIFLRLCTDGIAGLKFACQGYFKDTLAIIKAHFSYYYHIKKLNKKRNLINNKVNILQSKSIIFDYFVLNKKKFTA
ncbi:MAG: glycosyltransferase family 2 protein [Cytophagales bacterium]|nr:MAG: glycosyltransferase family 2 protein [Cytophagales bacterium]